LIEPVAPATDLVLHRSRVMANLTITIDDEVLKRARIRALERGTSVNAILGEYLRAFAGASDVQARATRSLIALAAENTKHGGRTRAKLRKGRRWTRDELHER
jgi:plasmid stability protein